MKKFLLLAAIVCIVYFISIIIYIGFSGLFNYFWILLAAALLATSYLLSFLEQKHTQIPIYVKGALILLLIFFIIVEWMIISEGTKEPEPGADYVIVLGAQVRGEIPSKILYNRIMTAYEYLTGNPQSKVIVSGGQGEGEFISEAECMRRVLVQKGIDENRIIKEEGSTNTDENIRHSLKLAGRDRRIVIVTCNFHIYRAIAIARKQGAERISGKASVSNILLMPNYYVREFFAVLKYKIAGQI